MSEPTRKEGGLKQPDPKPSEPAPARTETRERKSADDVEQEDSPGGREGGMIGEG